MRWAQMKFLLRSVLGSHVPGDHSRQVTIEHYVERVLKLPEIDRTYTVLDLGCGNGRSMKYFQGLNRKVDWYGVDIDSSPEVESRTENSDRLITFDGINIPFADGHFDLVHSNQVLEHVQHPRELLKEVSRVLKPGGVFVGSTSHLEPFHSYSLWNYTPYGFSVLMKEAQLALRELRPSIDALTLIIRRGLGAPRLLNVFWRIESPLNIFITLVGKLLWLSTPTINALKLMFCGQFVFYVTKDDAQSPNQRT
jgi:SAM-dependent methyltransferase